MATDIELLRRYAEDRSDEAFAELVRNHIGMVYNAALRQLGGDTHQAGEVTQTVFTDLARKAGPLSRHPALASWLHKAVRFSAAKLRRAEATRKQYEKEAATMCAEQNELGSPAWERLRPLIDELIGDLNERDRAAVLLRYFEGRSFAEVGASLHLSEDAARMRVARALDKMHALFGRRGITSSTSALLAMLASQPTAAVPAELAANVAGRALAMAGAGGSATAAVQFMSSFKVSAAITALALAMTLGVASYQWREVRRAQGLLAAANAETGSLLAQGAQAESRLQDASNDVTRLRARLDRLQKALASAAIKAKAKVEAAKITAAWNPTAEGDKFMARHPEVRRALDDYCRARVKWDFGPLLDSFHLPPDKLEKLIALLERGRGVGADGPDGSYGTKNIDLEENSRPLVPGERARLLNSVLDPDQVQQLSNWQRYMEARNFTNEVAGTLWSTSTPLVPAQADQLIQIIGPSNGRPFDWNSIIAKAGMVLAPAQVDVLRGMQAEDRVNHAISTP